VCAFRRLGSIVGQRYNEFQRVAKSFALLRYDNNFEPATLLKSADLARLNWFLSCFSANLSRLDLWLKKVSGYISSLHHIGRAMSLVGRLVFKTSEVCTPRLVGSTPTSSAKHNLPVY